MLKICSTRHLADVTHWRLLCVCFTLSLASASCSASLTEEQVATPSRSARPLSFSFSAPDGQTLSSEQLRGRVSLILLIATFDLASQLSVRQANELLHTQRPRINVGAVILEPPQYADLKETFQEAFALDYPVVMADHATLNGRGPFGEVVAAPGG